MKESWARVKFLIIHALGGYPKAYVDHMRRKHQQELAASAKVHDAQRDRIEMFILRETFGNQQFFERREQFLLALFAALQERATTFFKEVDDD